MPAREAFPDGVPCWIDLASSDMAKAVTFYSTLLGWDAEDMGEEYGHYTKFSKDGRVVAGLIGNTEGSGFPDGWTTYFAAGDVNALAEKAALAGAELLGPPFTVSDQGSVAHAADPSGATFGLWQGDKLLGFEAHAEEGAAVWHELATRQYQQCLEFYRRIFEWETRVESDSDSFRYTTGLVDGEQEAGILDARTFLPEGVPSAWTVYFGVKDTDAAAARVRELGGTVTDDPMDSAYGRVCTVTDPTGAAFRLISV
ncbi:VOC family protein [Arthrobacter sp. JZ12]|uniref:VOC family protein n=1 Tax=Arthrobacter sp. JZ12 TaxID=2654190 RepID=UPI002B464A56|nr:VOC family protein [Arthrobacter sp. JZ12]WRH26067.1 VOC family protein [Arthrobacter sp. JZ12]